MIATGIFESEPESELESELELELRTPFSARERLSKWFDN